MLHHSFSRTADEQMGKAGPAMGSDDDQVKAFLIGDAADLLERHA
jgi:hypothetical protein